MATNLDMLDDVKNAIFVDEVLSKTRYGGLPWYREAPDRYHVSICEPPLCFNPRRNGSSWFLALSRTLLVPASTYVFTLDVLADGHPYLSFDSRQMTNVETLFSQAEKLVGRQEILDRGILFIGNIPNSPYQPIFTSVMCGGLTAGGIASIAPNFTPALTYGGVIMGSKTIVTESYIVGTSGGGSLSGAAILS